MDRLSVSPLFLARRAVTDRTALAVAGLALVLGVVLGLPALTIVTLAIAGWAVEIVLRLALETSTTSRPWLRVDPVRPEGKWLARCEQSVTAIDALARSAPRGPVADRCRSIATNAALSIEEIRRIAGRATQIGTMLERIDSNRLVAEASLLEADAEVAGSAQVSAELRRAMESLRAQQDVHERLTTAGEAALARVRTASAGLDGLVARMAEIVALSDEGLPAVTGAAADNLGQLAQEMEALRAGLAESTTELMETN
jgi:hypothetical protein